MSYRFKMTASSCIINFSEEYVRTPIQLINSEGFRAILKAFISHGHRHENDWYLYLTRNGVDDVTLQKDLKNIARLLLVMRADEIAESYEKYAPYFEDVEMLYQFIERLYTYWRRHQRYCVIKNSTNSNGLEDVSFLDAQDQFQALVLQTYRTCESALGYKNLVYRQITAGVNAGLSLSTMRSTLPYEYRALDRVPFIEQVIIHPPFIAHSKRNKRDGVFPETFENPIEGKSFDPDEWFCYPAKVGDLLAFVYFNVGYMGQGITLCNLFELAEPAEYLNKRPDLIYVYGYDDHQKTQCFYQDNENDMMVGFLSLDDDFDYFGYMKKMILTLHNVRKINTDQLPIHGAMVEITFHNGKKKNVVVMGDSGAGKSETIEQIKGLGSKDIREIKTIYDDMGLLSLGSEGEIQSSGTEIGAFVRLDDLDAGYGYKEFDRAVFMNPEQLNARIVIPITPWKDVVAKHPVDFFLYANNYDADEKAVTFFKNATEALEVFRKGARMAKGTTTEMGLTESYFANPFGPVQRREQCEPVLQAYFNNMFAQNIKVGQLRTRLGIRGMEHTGPKEAAKELLEILKQD